VCAKDGMESGGQASRPPACAFEPIEGGRDARPPACQPVPACSGLQTRVPGSARIIAWGNRGRSDDGVALVLAERLEVRFAGRADVCVQQFHQLAPELAADLDDCRLAVFVDAHVRDEVPEVCVERVTPVDAAAFNTHHCPPPVLLALARSMGYNVPAECWMVTIRAHCFDFGDTLSAATAAAMAEAEAVIVRLITQ
jgi:hydrogenase maturation protease